MASPRKSSGKSSGRKPGRSSGKHSEAGSKTLDPETLDTVSLPTFQSDGQSEEQSGHLAPFLQDDDTLLERSRVYWQTGEWEKLAALADENLESFTDRSTLALLAAVGFAHTGDMSRSRRRARLARSWGVGRDFLSRVLIGVAYNSLRRMAARQGDEPRAMGISTPRSPRSAHVRIPGFWPAHAISTKKRGQACCPRHWS